MKVLNIINCSVDMDEIFKHKSVSEKQLNSTREGMIRLTN